MRYRWFLEERQERDEMGIPMTRQPIAPPEKKTHLSRGELIGSLISVLILVYGIVVEDLPTVFFAFAFIAFEARPFAEIFGGARGKSISNLLLGLTISLAVGTLLWVFL